MPCHARSRDGGVAASFGEDGPLTTKREVRKRQDGDERSHSTSRSHDHYARSYQLNARTGDDKNDEYKNDTMGIEKKKKQRNKQER